MRAYRDGRDLKLSKTEFEILSLLYKNRGKVFSREQLLKEVWGYDQFQGDLRTVDVAIARLRAKVEDSPGTPQIIKSRRGAGYFNAAFDCYCYRLCRCNFVYKHYP